MCMLHFTAATKVDLILTALHIRVLFNYFFLEKKKKTTMNLFFFFFFFILQVCC